MVCIRYGTPLPPQKKFGLFEVNYDLGQSAGQYRYQLTRSDTVRQRVKVSRPVLTSLIQRSVMKEGYCARHMLWDPPPLPPLAKK